MNVGIPSLAMSVVAPNPVTNTEECVEEQEEELRLENEKIATQQEAVLTAPGFEG